ncbi:hypothetical protein D3C87_1859170 [compost metagenome]
MVWIFPLVDTISPLAVTVPATLTLPPDVIVPTDKVPVVVISPDVLIAEVEDSVVAVTFVN